MGIEKLFKNLFSIGKCKPQKHIFALSDMLNTGKGEDSQMRIRWHCRKCGEIFHANCGLDILENGTVNNNYQKDDEVK